MLEVAGIYLINGLIPERVGKVYIGKVSEPRTHYLNLILFFSEAHRVENNATLSPSYFHLRQFFVLSNRFIFFIRQKCGVKENNLIVYDSWHNTKGSRLRWNLALEMTWETFLVLNTCSKKTCLKSFTAVHSSVSIQTCSCSDFYVSVEQQSAGVWIPTLPLFFKKEKSCIKW